MQQSACPKTSFAITIKVASNLAMELGILLRPRHTTISIAWYATNVALDAEIDD